MATPPYYAAQGKKAPGSQAATGQCNVEGTKALPYQLAPIQRVRPGPRELRLIKLIPRAYEIVG